MDHVIMVLVWYHICDKRVFQGVHAFCGLSILYTYGLHHSWGVLIMTVTSDTSSFWYIRNPMYRAAIHQGFDVSVWQGCSRAQCMIQQAIHHGLDVSIQRDTSNLMYRQGSGLHVREEVTIRWIAQRAGVEFGIVASRFRMTAMSSWTSAIYRLLDADASGFSNV